MKALWLDKKIDYTGAELSSKWIKQNTGLNEDVIVAFRGAADVGEDHMVDLEDLKNKAFIFSEDMLHFIVEIKDMNLDRAIALQRLLIAEIKDVLEEKAAGLRLVRSGDDLFEGEYKLTVSIATLSPNSSMIHTGINVSSKNTPVKTKGLSDYKLDAKVFADDILKKFKEECLSMQKAKHKVRGVK